MDCTNIFLGICFSPIASTANVFGFKDFIAALALLVIIYTISDIRYRFRISVAPTQLYKISFLLIILIGIGTLITDIWISDKFPVPKSLLTAAIWQGVLAALFLGLVITWMYYAFIKPPIFGRNNYKRYAYELYRIILKGSDDELPAIANELAASSESLVSLAAAQDSEDYKLKPCAGSYAKDLLLLIANPRFCRYLVASSPTTAIRFLDAVTKFDAYHIPIGPFAQNVSTEAIKNKDSSLYQEIDGYYSGLLGYTKPFSQALYGNYRLVAALENHSPLDLHYKFIWAWDADQMETYCRVALLTVKNFLDSGYWDRDSIVIHRVLREIQEATCRAIMDFKKTEWEYLGDEWSRLRVGVDFIADCINAIGELERLPNAHTLRIRDRFNNPGCHDLYDHLAEAMFEIIITAASIDGPPDRTWSIHHNATWGEFFRFDHDSHPWNVVQFKLRRLLYDEILRLASMPNYKSAKALGICLNVLGLKTRKRSGFGRNQAALKWAILAWTERNYLQLRKVNAEVADACLIGGISFDEGQSRLVKTYAKGLHAEPQRDFLQLQTPSPDIQ